MVIEPTVPSAYRSLVLAGAVADFLALAAVGALITQLRGRRLGWSYSTFLSVWVLQMIGIALADLALFAGISRQFGWATLSLASAVVVLLTSEAVWRVKAPARL